MGVLRTVGGLSLALFSVSVITFGGTFLWAWLHMRFGQPFYLESDHFFLGVFWMVLGLLALAPCLYVVLRRRAHGAWLLLSTALLILPAVTIPSSLGLESARGLASGRVAVKLSEVAESILAWSEESGRFPANEAELQEAVKATLAESAQPPSPFREADKLLPYRAVYIGNATTANVSDPGQYPGVFHCAVSADLNRLWLTATDLDHAVRGRVRFLPTWDGAKPLVRELKREPATAPTKE